MIIHKFRKLIASVLFIALTSTMIPCSAANLVPFNGTKPIVTPAVPITKLEANNSTDCEKCTLDEAINLKDKEGYLCINPDVYKLVSDLFFYLYMIGANSLIFLLGVTCCCKCCWSDCCPRNSNHGYRRTP